MVEIRTDTVISAVKGIFCFGHHILPLLVLTKLLLMPKHLLLKWKKTIKTPHYLTCAGGMGEKANEYPGKAVVTAISGSLVCM